MNKCKTVFKLQSELKHKLISMNLEKLRIWFPCRRCHSSSKKCYSFDSRWFLFLFLLWMIGSDWSISLSGTSHGWPMSWDKKWEFSSWLDGSLFRTISSNSTLQSLSSINPLALHLSSSSTIMRASSSSSVFSPLQTFNKVSHDLEVEFGLLCFGMLKSRGSKGSGGAFVDAQLNLFELSSALRWVALPREPNTSIGVLDILEVLLIGFFAPQSIVTGIPTLFWGKVLLLKFDILSTICAAVSKVCMVLNWGFAADELYSRVGFLALVMVGTLAAIVWLFLLLRHASFILLMVYKWVELLWEFSMFFGAIISLLDDEGWNSTKLSCNGSTVRFLLAEWILFPRGTNLRTFEDTWWFKMLPEFDEEETALLLRVNIIWLVAEELVCSVMFCCIWLVWASFLSTLGRFVKTGFAIPEFSTCVFGRIFCTALMIFWLRFDKSGTLWQDKSPAITTFLPLVNYINLKIKYFTRTKLEIKMWLPLRRPALVNEVDEHFG